MSVVQIVEHTLYVKLLVQHTMFVVLKLKLGVFI